MQPDPLSFPTIPTEPAQPARRSDSAAGESAFASIYSEAMQAANEEMSQIVSDSSGDSGADIAGDDSMSFLALRAGGFGLDGSGSLSSMDGDVSVTRGELMQQIGAIRLGQGPVAAGGSMERATPDLSARNAMATPVSAAGQGAENPIATGIHRLISWLDTHAHLHSAHHCAASVRQAMEAAGMATEDRPVSGDAGDYGPFLVRHGAEVIPQQSYEPKAGDIAVFDRSDDHPAGHIQVFDGEHWVSDFVQHTFSPYRDQESTPPVTVYRLS
jgi:hypothetical protein